MKKSAIIKIDLCGSKDYIDKHKNYEGNIREKLLDDLSQFVKGIYPYSDKAYPEGCIYSAQGDCIYIVLDRPTVAVRSTIELMKGWYSNVPSLPDCRAVIDYGEINESKTIGKLELLGEPFENIAKMEKHFNAGQIGVTDKVIDKSDNTIVQYIRPIEIDITKSRKINTYIANYEDPRLIQYSSLAHALFIADPPGANIRDKAFEAFLIEAILEMGEAGLSLELFKNWLHDRNIPEPSPVELERIVNNSKFIDCDDKDIFCYKASIDKKIESVQESFINSQNKAIDHIISKIAEKIGISSNELSDNLDIKSLTEEYLCSVFLQIRMMANYFRSTGSLFERLSSYKEFDYIIIKYFKRISPDRIEEFTLFKRAFLEALKDLAHKNDMYVASIFHNVLLLYYLNRNSRLSQGQLSAIKEKEIYLDTNTFYASTCRASTFHRILDFTFTRLRKLGSSIFLFDKSLIEYLDSLESTLHKYRHNRHYEFINGGPWIWKEFISDVSRYKNDFEYCIALHKYPKRGYSLGSSTHYILWSAILWSRTCLTIAWYGTGFTCTACCTTR